jgi:lipoprotein-anchoring transpeptidase ErfK/SrfK
MAVHQEATRLSWGGLVALLALLLVLAATLLFCGWVFDQRMQRFYRERIYPNVYVLGENLGGMTRREAQEVLGGISDYPEVEGVILRQGERTWVIPWTDAGLALDTRAMVDAAYGIGRGEATLRERLAIWLDEHTVPPLYTVDLEQMRAVLEELSAEVSVPPTEPIIRLENGEVVIEPGEPGRVLDVTTMLGQLSTLSAEPGEEISVDLVFRDVQPLDPETGEIEEQVKALADREITLTAYDVLTEERLSWTLGPETIVTWLHLVPGPEGEPVVDLNLYAIRDSLVALAEELGDGRGFRYDEAAQQVLAAFDAGEEEVALYLSHPERTYTVQPGDTLTSVAQKFGMPPGLVYEANWEIDLDRLQVGQQITIPSQDVLTPHRVDPGKKIVINLDEQRMRVYEGGALLHDWPVSTGMEDSPTDRGTFQILSKEEMAFASQWDLWMPYFMAIYRVGGDVHNGIHELPILENGQRLWEGHLGSPASYGCVILGIPEAETLFDWAEIGTLVIVE